MAMPTVAQIEPVLLEALGDGDEHAMDELIEVVCDRLGLTAEERGRKMPKGVKYVYDRVHWARTSLRQKGLLVQPYRAPARITARGRQALAGRAGSAAVRGARKPAAAPPTPARAQGATTAAVAVWVAVATLHRKHGTDRSFSSRQIREMVERQRICSVATGTVESHVSRYCVANNPAGAERHRKIYRVEHGTYRLYRPGDDYHDDRKGGPEEPSAASLPAEYRNLLEWYAGEYCGPKGRSPAATRGAAVVLDSSVINPWIKGSEMDGSVRKWLDANADMLVVTGKTARELHLEKDAWWSDDQRRRLRGLPGFGTEVAGYSRQKVDALQKKLVDDPSSAEAGKWIKDKRRGLLKSGAARDLGYEDADDIRPSSMSGSRKADLLHRLFHNATADRDLLAQCLKMAEDRLVVLFARDMDFVSFLRPDPRAPTPEKNAVLVLVFNHAVVIGYANDGCLAVAEGLAGAEAAFGEEEMKSLYDIEAALRI